MNEKSQGNTGETILKKEREDKHQEQRKRDHTAERHRE
jgi:hypothetical protein